ncbi:DMT family transporter [Pararhizobium haloflavum]|uniref:DMT family transporter n=1 Tax=Pararhizobium haloflavum TaxID=2037914 RepID=UPI001FE161CE|nr:DMT family transporter [Pararhizobium haloflavum]
MTQADDLDRSETTMPRNYAIGREKLLGHLAMLCFALLVAGSFSLGSRAAPHIGPAAINAIRFVIGVAVMGAAAALMLRGSGVRLLAWPVGAWRFAVLGGLMALYFVTMFIALGITSPVSTGAVFTLIPFLSAVFGYLFLRQTVGPIVLVSLMVAGAGALWVIFDGRLAALLRFSVGRGEAIFFVGCLAHAAYAPLVKRFNRKEPLAYFTFWTLSATGGWIALYAVPEIARTAWTGLPPIVWATILYLAVFTTAATFFLLQYASMRLPVSKVFGYSYLTPSFIIVFEGLAGAGWTSTSVAIGALVTVMGLVVLVVAAD